MRVHAAVLPCLLALAGCGTAPLAPSASPAEGPAPLRNAPAGPPSLTTRAEASCVGPYLDDRGGRPDRRPPTFRPGQTIELHGFFYTRTCNDTGQDRPLVPLPDVRLAVTFPGGDVVHLGPFTPGGHQIGFTTHIAIPACASNGMATVTDDRAHPATYRFRVRR